MKADVDVNTVTALGEFVVRKLPAEGKIFVKPLGGGFEQTIGDLEILETTAKTITLSATVNVTNPTDYSARVPYVNISVSSNGTDLGFATARDVDVVPGKNVVKVQAELEIGRELLSQYISGYNTTLTLRSHAGTIPSLPRLGEALSGLKVEIDTPRVLGHFIKEATV